MSEAPRRRGPRRRPSRVGAIVVAVLLILISIAIRVAWRSADYSHADCHGLNALVCNNHRGTSQVDP